METSVSVPTYWLSFHAPYACRHSGVCCSSGWDIEIEQTRVPAVASAVADRRLAAPAQWYRRVDGAPPEIAGVLARRPGGGCVFHQGSGCAVHHVLGHAALPSACQHFPRVVLIDPRGVFVTLSHYCPTAARLLIDATNDVAVVEGPPVLPDGREPEGLDARDALPPLDAPGRLMDWSDYSAWERRAIELLTRSECLERALAAIGPSPAIPGDRELFEMARDAVPAGLKRPSYVPFRGKLPGGVSRVAGRYLAAHVFAAWTAYFGDGLHSTVLYLHVVLAVLKTELARGRSLVEAIRHSDLLVRHLADRETLAERLLAVAAH
jgi:hypothetical protein